MTGSKYNPPKSGGGGVQNEVYARFKAAMFPPVELQTMEAALVTDHGKAVAEIQPLLRESEAEDNPFKRRVLLPGFAKLMNRPIGGTNSTQIISEGRDRETL